jgi:hypothetical protein
MKRIKRLRARTEKYKDKTTGEEKQGYITCGYLLEKPDGDLVVKMDSVPVIFDGWLFCGDLESQQALANSGMKEQPRAQQQHQGNFDEDVPF